MGFPRLVGEELAHGVTRLENSSPPAGTVTEKRFYARICLLPADVHQEHHNQQRRALQEERNTEIPANDDRVYYSENDLYFIYVSTHLQNGINIIA